MTHTRFAATAIVLVIAGCAACNASPETGAAAAASTASAANPAPPAAAATPGPGLVASGTSPAANPGTFSGTVTETMNSGGYTYMKLRGGASGKEDVWVAAAEFAVKQGERVSVPLEMAMNNFHSNTLKRDFPVIYFVSKVAREGESLAGGPDPAAGAAAPIALMGSHQSSAAAAPVETIAPAPGGLTIAAVWEQRKALSGKAVVVHGKVVKVNNGIMDRNWIHLQDGSGKAADGTNDLTITTASVAKVGDVVTASGVLAIAKDFGAGYAYDAILENATVTGK